MCTATSFLASLQPLIAESCTLAEQQGLFCSLFSFFFLFSFSLYFLFSLSPLTPTPFLPRPHCSSFRAFSSHTHTLLATPPLFPFPRIFCISSPRLTKSNSNHRLRGPALPERWRHLAHRAPGPDLPRPRASSDFPSVLFLILLILFRREPRPATTACR